MADLGLEDPDRSWLEHLKPYDNEEEAERQLSYYIKVHADNHAANGQTSASMKHTNDLNLTGDQLQEFFNYAAPGFGRWTGDGWHPNNCASSKGSVGCDIKHGFWMVGDKTVAEVGIWTFAVMYVLCFRIKKHLI